MRADSTAHAIAALCTRCSRESARLVRRLAVETGGDDLVEYALLTTFIGLAGAAAWTAMQTSLGAAYNSWIAAAWNLWDPPDPGGS